MRSPAPDGMVEAVHEADKSCRNKKCGHPALESTDRYCPICGRRLCEEPKIVFVAGQIGSGKSTLALKLRQKLAHKHRAQWEVIRPDARSNLFFEMLNLDEPRDMDDAEGPYSLFTGPTSGPSVARTQVELMMEETFLLEVCSRLRDELDKPSGAMNLDGVMVEYWPRFSVEVMGKAQLSTAMNEDEQAVIELMNDRGEQALLLEAKIPGAEGLKIRVEVNPTGEKICIFDSNRIGRTYTASITSRGGIVNYLANEINRDPSGTVWATVLTPGNRLKSTHGPRPFKAPREDKYRSLTETLDGCMRELIKLAPHLQSPDAIFVVAEDTRTVMERNAKRKANRQNEKLDEDFIERLDAYSSDLLLDYGLPAAALPRPPRHQGITPRPPKIPLNRPEYWRGFEKIKQTGGSKPPQSLSEDEWDLDWSIDPATERRNSAVRGTRRKIFSFIDSNGDPSFLVSAPHSLPNSASMEIEVQGTKLTLSVNGGNIFSEAFSATGSVEDLTGEVNRKSALIAAYSVRPGSTPIRQQGRRIETREFLVVRDGPCLDLGEGIGGSPLRNVFGRGLSKYLAEFLHDL